MRGTVRERERERERRRMRRKEEREVETELISPIAYKFTMARKRKSDPFTR